ncbi:prolyl oligopeptidase family serine peptidase [Elizabethkingia argentiflava]|uniref:Prolyl oligopeptidase family serine peptidase n=1 Tax=Elizabethkingia argenteiflava TaxID=2681556 RepID=A0A845PR21_9FLAO|nr:S9 family peptidase [Elizabethkingia argenteiflava]NAW50739.1 prolyl oligopeptidase family serine peptidase [Elizabethkingia argenteiflava]
MKKMIFNLSIILGFFFQESLAQEITLDKIYSGYYFPQEITDINFLKDGENYTIIEPGGIARYSSKNMHRIDYMVEGNFEDYTFSEDESKVLLQKRKEEIYRRSFHGIFDIKDLKSGKILPVNQGKWVQEPKFSPDGSKLAFIVDNDLFYQDLNDGSIVQITRDGKQNEIINGLADWVYEEEFGHADYYEWNKAGDAIVFVKFDERKVPQVNIPIYNDNLYPQMFSYKYPKAGEENSIVTAHLYQLPSRSLVKINLADFENYYIPNLYQTNAKDEIVFATSNRHQNKIDLVKVNTKNAQVKKLFTEKDAAWVDTNNLQVGFLEDNSFLWASERDGKRHLYWYDANGKLKKQVSKGDWEIVDYYGYNPKTKDVYIQTTETGSINKVLTKLNIVTGKKQLLSEPQGSSSASFSKTFNHFISTYSTANQPPKYLLNEVKGSVVKELNNNDEILSRLKHDHFINKEFLSIPNAVGDQMNAWMIKPHNFNPAKKYPVFMYQYSGPGSQSVSNSWDPINGMWFEMLAQKGYIVVCVDGRGTGFRGSQYKKVTYKNLGKYEIEDQIYAAKWLGEQPYVDAARIGIFGWSFGGYMAALAMTKGADTFKMGIAVAPVTNWRFYDSIYTERFLRTPQENVQGYDLNSPTTFASLLKGKLLLIHGTADDNVHFQNSMVFSEALIQYKKDFDFMAYPDKNHSIYGGNTRLQLYEKMTAFILKNL